MNCNTSKHPRVPTEDLVSWVFNGTQYDREKPVCIMSQRYYKISAASLHRCKERACKLLWSSYVAIRLANDATAQILIDPSDPSRYISYNKARELVGKLATGFRRAGLRPGDCVIVNSGNDVREKPEPSLAYKHRAKNYV